MFRSSSTTLGRRDWDHVWYIGISPSAKQTSSIAALRKIFELEGIDRFAASCEVVRNAPLLFGVKDEWLVVPIVADPSATRPRAVTPDEADAAMRRTRGHDTEPIFTKEEKAAMVGTTFETPTVRVFEEGRPDFGGHCGDLGCFRVFVVYSPESAKVYLLERSFTDIERTSTMTQHFERVVDVERAQAPALGPWLRSLPITSLRFPLANACDIPDELGGKRWYDIDVGALP